MFKSISWQEFIIAVSVAAACYYAAIIIIFYSRDIAARLKGGRVSTGPAKVPETSRAARNLMGPIAPAAPVKRKPVVQSSASAEEVEVQEEPHAAEAIPSTAAEELLQELRNLFEIMKEGKPSQESYVKNINTLISQYSHLICSEEYSEISQTIVEELKTKHNIFLSTEMVDEFWPKESARNNSHTNK